MNGQKNLIRYSISRSAHQTRYKTQLNNITYQKVTNEKNYDIQKGEDTMARIKTAATFCKGNLTMSIKNFNVLYFDPDMSPLLGIYLIDVCAEIHQHIYIHSCGLYCKTTCPTTEDCLTSTCTHDRLLCKRRRNEVEQCVLIHTYC